MTKYRIFYFVRGITQWNDFQAEDDISAREEAKKFTRKDKIKVEVLMNVDNESDLHLRFDPSKEVSNG